MERVCICYRSSLKLLVIGYLDKCLSFELKISDKICNFVALYRSRSQSNNNVETLKILVQKDPFLITAIGDFNAKFTNWYNKDKTSFEGNTIENITSQLGLIS